MMSYSSFVLPWHRPQQISDSCTGRWDPDSDVLEWRIAQRHQRGSNVCFGCAVNEKSRQFYTCSRPSSAAPLVQSHPLTMPCVSSCYQTRDTTVMSRSHAIPRNALAEEVETAEDSDAGMSIT